MAMNKKEQAMVEALKTEASFYKTLEVLPDLHPPKETGELTKGYVYMGALSDYPTVVVACSSKTGHNVGRNDETSTKNPIDLFSTKILALRALRHKVEKQACEKLRRIDKMIEKEVLGE